MKADVQVCFYIAKMKSIPFSLTHSQILSFNVVTDIAWGYLPSSKGESIVMVVSLLDGFMVALKFDMPLELGNLLSKEKRHKIFRLKYGIELGKGGSGRRLVDDKSGPKLIENILQFAMEDEDEDNDVDMEDNEGEDDDVDDNELSMDQSMKEMESSKQIETYSKSGKKRIQPVLLNQPTSPVKMNGIKNKLGVSKSKSQSKEKQNSVSAALQLAEKAATVAESISRKNIKHGNNTDNTNADNERGFSSTSANPAILMAPTFNKSPIQIVVPPKTNQNTFTIELKSLRSPYSQFDEHQIKSTSEKVSVIATCTNSNHSPSGIGRNVPCATLSVTRSGDRTWKDHIFGTRCTSLAACSCLLAVGTLDGTVYLYGTSKTTGWDSGIGFRSHAPFVVNSSIVHLFLQEKQKNNNGVPQVEMLVLTADGSFGVYSIMPIQKLIYKGDIRAPITQMCLSASYHQSRNTGLPELARIFITESEHLLLILCHPHANRLCFGGAIQGFVYNRDMEVWTRISDERFIHSNFYTTVPSSRLARGLLSMMDETVKGRRGMINSTASSMCNLLDDDENCLQSFVTRAHCEDRLACALALKSSDDFRHWLCLYIRQLCVEADSNQLRFLVDMLLNDGDTHAGSETGDTENQSCWWLLSGSSILGIDKRQIVEKVIIPEMSKNRSLQRLLNEFSTEVNSI